MKVRQMMEQLQALSRRGFGDDEVLLEVQGKAGPHLGRSVRIVADTFSVCITTRPEEEEGA